MPALTRYVAQYQGNADVRLPGRDPEDWIDVTVRATPEEAFERLDAFKATWNPYVDQEGYPRGFRVVKRVITDMVIADPRPAPEAAEAEVVS